MEIRSEYNLYFKFNAVVKRFVLSVFINLRCADSVCACTYGLRVWLQI